MIWPVPTDASRSIATSSAPVISEDPPGVLARSHFSAPSIDDSADDEGGEELIEKLVQSRNASWGTKLTAADAQTLQTAILRKEDFGPKSIQELTLTNSGQALWTNGYSEFNTGA